MFVLYRSYTYLDLNQLNLNRFNQQDRGHCGCYLVIGYIKEVRIEVYRFMKYPEDINDLDQLVSLI